MVAPDVAETPMSVASAAAEPYVPTPASTVRSTGKENETSWANGRPSHWLSDHRNPMYGQVCMLLLLLVCNLAWDTDSLNSNCVAWGMRESQADLLSSMCKGIGYAREGTHSTRRWV